MGVRRQPLTTARRRLLTAGVVIAVIGVFAGVLYQPWLAQWGSTAAERRAAVVGDDVVANADTTWARSITIDAPPAQVWPWLVQTGEGRGGFYNYDWGEQLFLDPIHNATTVHPEWQTLQVGDTIHPKPGGDWRVVVADPDRTLVLENPLVTPTDWTWATELRPVGTDQTRVVTRIRNHKGSFFSYALDVPDLVLFPRLLSGLKQRAEGTLPGMAGTDTGRPFPLARLPVHWWAALAWLAGLAVLALAGRRAVGVGRWRRQRPHPHVVFWIGFVVGAGYLLMSDTPPVQFFTHRWAAGVAAAVVIAIVAARRGAIVENEVPAGHWVSRGVTAIVEAGLFVIVPVTAVWQAATALGWTASITGHVLVAATAAAAATAIATLAWHDTTRSMERIWFATALAAWYAATGAGIAALGGALLVELIPARRRVDVDMPASRPTDLRQTVGAARGGS